MAAFITIIIAPEITAAMEPTERSIPPAVITKVAPTAMMPIKAERVRRLEILPSEAKAGLSASPNKHNAISATSGPKV